MGSFPHELPGYRHVSDAQTREASSACGVPLQPNPGLRIPNMFEAAIDGGSFFGLYVQGEDIAQSDPDTQHVEANAFARWNCVVVQDLFPQRDGQFAHVFLPGSSVPREGRHLHQCRASHQPGAPVMPALGRPCRVAGRLRDRHGDGLFDALRPSRPRSWTRSPRLTPSFAGVSLCATRPSGQRSSGRDARHPDGTAGDAQRNIRARPRAVHGHRVCADRGAGRCRISRCC
jgi:formate dehydrogenase major subunit